MTTPKQLLDTGDLRGAIDAATREVKSSPTDSRLRTVLFELLATAGEWDRADKQLEVLRGQNPGGEVAFLVYAGAIRAERDRARVFAGETRPGFLRPPPAYVEHALEALALLRLARPAEARSALERGEEERPALPGRVDGRSIADVRDMDDLLAPVLEVFVGARYVWLPFEQVRRIEITKPTKLRDLVWAGARIEADDGTVGNVLVPALYQGTASHPDGLVRLGRLTVWTGSETELPRPAGLRCLLLGDEEHALFEFHVLEVDPPLEAAV